LPAAFQNNRELEEEKRKRRLEGQGKETIDRKQIAGK
jgi:hypothetical protein